MHSFLRPAWTVLALLFMAEVAQAQVYETVEVNQRTQQERSNGYFDIEVSDGSYGRLNFTVHLKEIPPEVLATTPVMARLEVIEGGQAIGTIPIQRRVMQDQRENYLNFELKSELAAKCVLVLVQPIGKAGNLYRVDLFSYTEEGAQQARPLIDEVVKIEFPKDGYSYTLAEAAKGVKIEYQVIVEHDLEDVIPLPFGPSFAEPAGPSGLYPREIISGNNQVYGLLDAGLAPPPQEVVQTLKQGTYRHAFAWDGRNWRGPSDTSTPKGPPFPAGEYEVKVTVHGLYTTNKGKTPYEITRKAKLTLK